MLKKISKSLLYKLVEFSFYKRKTREDKRDGRRKLLIVRIDAIGDFIMFSPMLKYYRMLYPDYHITLLVNKLALDLAERFDEMDEMIAFDKKRFKRDLIYRRSLLKREKDSAFNVVIYPAYSREPNGDYIVIFSEAKEKIGFDGDNCNITSKEKSKNDKAYTKIIPATASIIVEIERNREFVEALGIKTKDIIPSFMPIEDDQRKAKTILLENGLKKDMRYIIICLGAGSEKRIWPLEKYAQVVTWLKKKDVEIIISGSNNESHLARKIETITDVPIIDITGKTSLPILAAILKKSLLYIGNDTGIVHLASAVGTPTVCIMGGGHFGRFFPYGDVNKNRIVYKKMDCFGCNWKCKHDRIRCIEDITIEQVMEEIRRMGR